MSRVEQTKGRFWSSKGGLRLSDEEITRTKTPTPVHPDFNNMKGRQSKSIDLVGIKNAFNEGAFPKASCQEARISGLGLQPEKRPKVLPPAPYYYVVFMIKGHVPIVVKMAKSSDLLAESRKAGLEFIQSL